MVCLCRVRPYHHEYAHNDAEQVCYCPPCEVWKGASDSGDNGGDEGDEPSKLSQASISFVPAPLSQLEAWVETYVCYRYGRERERVANNVS